MKITKKIIGVVLALIMVFNVFAMGSFAAFPEDTLVKLMITPDKTTYAPGDEITFTVSAQTTAELGTLMIGGQYDLAYQSSVLSPYTTSTTLNDHGFVALQNGYAAGYSGVQMPSACSGPANMHGWDATICYVVVDTGADVFDATSKTDLFTVKMKINENAAYGKYVVGFNPVGYEEYNGYINDGIGLGGLYGTSATDFGFSVPNMYEYGTCEITVGAAEEPFPSTSIVNPLKGQIRFNKDKDGKFASFDVRAMAVISKADFESKFAEGEAAEAPGVIKDIGFVFAAGSKVSGMTYENVKKVVEGGETVEGYAIKPVNFISTSIDSPNYVFTCVVTGMTAVDYEDSLLAVAYIAYADEDGNAVYCYYPAVQEVSYSGLIDEYYDDIFGEAFTK